jgi:hypothetical protein
VCEVMDWIKMIQDRIQWRTHEHGIESSGSIRGEEYLD